MDKARAAVSDFMAKSGHHDTTVHETVAPAVVREEVRPKLREEVQTAIDKEIHQDHYHTSVQPVKDRTVLPEQHQHKLVGVEHRQFEHGNSAEVEARLMQERKQFRDERVMGATETSRSAAPTVAGEHIHHHVHETIQPVVQKETIQPTVVHTTVPIHEVHHNAAQVHTTSALPAVTMDEFKRQGGVLTGREERYDGFEGEPRSVGGVHHGGSHHSGATAAVGAGAGASALGAAGGVARRHRRGSSSSSSSSEDEKNPGYSRAGRQKKKGSLMDKLNPMKDSDGDGKAGFMK